ncbi:hypothetical protein ACNVED_05650 [Legionella sp. D16C41]|uniref:hypothetical protein n=1 Tax=Legionella sp. D16C41 TaxID=3402688 RepID=UPI003AF9A59E
MSKKDLLSNMDKVVDAVNQFNSIKKEVEDELSIITSINYGDYKDRWEQNNKIHNSIMKIIALKIKIQQGLNEFIATLDKITTEGEIDETEAVYAAYKKLVNNLDYTKTFLETVRNNTIKGTSVDFKTSNLTKEQKKEKINSFMLSNISMQVLGGFISVIGISAIVFAFIALNAATFGISGLIVAGGGVVATLIGIGLFKTGVLKQKIADGLLNKEPLNFSNNLA